jgi:diaminopimelate epimerase
MDFTKIQGAGNDFILIESEDAVYDWPTLARTMCDRHFGIGGDGLLIFSSSDKADVRMRIFNSDGSEAEACGNGTRCVVKYADSRGMIRQDAAGIVIETMSGLRQARLNRENGTLTDIKIAMGCPKFLAPEIPVAIRPTRERPLEIIPLLNYAIDVAGRTLRLFFVNMGNPHAVFFTQEPVAGFPLAQIGPMVENHSIFPKRMNFEVARILDNGEIEARVWERGAGETLACGTGACAITVAARLLGYTGKEVNVRLPGGKLQLEWDTEHEVMLGGPVSITFRGEWPDK